MGLEGWRAEAGQIKLSQLAAATRKLALIDIIEWSVLGLIDDLLQESAHVRIVPTKCPFESVASAGVVDTGYVRETSMTLSQV
jgi:hypothetical protein